MSFASAERLPNSSSGVASSKSGIQGSLATVLSGVGNAENDNTSHITHFLNKFPQSDLNILIQDMGLSDDLKIILAKLANHDSLGNVERKRLFLELTRNFPYINILRMGKGDVLRNFTFGGIKALNDKFGQVFADEILFAIKSQIIKNAQILSFQEYPRRLIRENYKNFTYSFRENNLALQEYYNMSIKGLSNGGFKQLPQIENIVEQGAVREFMIELNSKGITEFRGFDTAPEKLDQKILSCPICFQKLRDEIFSSNEFVDLGFDPKKIVIQKIKSFESVLNGLYVSLGEATVGDLDDFQENLITFFMAERFSVISAIEGKKYASFSVKKIENYLKSIDVIYKKILSFKGKTFTSMDGSNALVVISTGNGDIINPMLLKSVRKGKDIGNKILFKLVQKYTLRKNAICDNIKDGIYEDMEMDFGVAKGINNIIAKIRLKKALSKFEILMLTKFLKITQKGVITKKTFKDYVSSQEDGVLGYTDIKDMGFENSQDFTNILKAMVKPDGTLNLSAILKAGDSVTKKLKFFVSSLVKEFGEKITLTLGGDEIWRYLKGDFDPNEMQHLLRANNLRGRTSYKRIFNSIVEIDKELAFLDKSTILVKMLEDMLLGFKDEYGKSLDYDINFDIGKFDSQMISNDFESIRNLFGDDKFCKSFDEFLKGNDAEFRLYYSISNGKQYVLIKTLLGLELKIIDK